MFKIALQSQKGGAGKTTLATSLAVEFAQRGQSIALVDCDPQESAADWAASRPADATPIPCEPRQPSELAGLLANLPTDITLIDTAGRDGPSTKLVANLVDLVLIPVKPSALDIRATVKTVMALEATSARFAFVVNQSPAQAGRANAATDALKNLGLVAPVRIVNRALFQDATHQGLAPSEIDKGHKASTEIAALADWIMTQKPT